MGAAQLPAERRRLPEATAPSADPTNQRLSAVEARHILLVLQQAGGNQTEAACRLDIGVATLYRKLQDTGCSPGAGFGSLSNR